MDFTNEVFQNQESIVGWGLLILWGVLSIIIVILYISPRRRRDR